MTPHSSPQNTGGRGGQPENHWKSPSHTSGTRTPANIRQGELYFNSDDSNRIIFIKNPSIYDRRRHAILRQQLILILDGEQTLGEGADQGRAH